MGRDRRGGSARFDHILELEAYLRRRSSRGDAMACIGIQLAQQHSMPISKHAISAPLLTILSACLAFSSGCLIEEADEELLRDGFVEGADALSIGAGDGLPPFAYFVMSPAPAVIGQAVSFDAARSSDSDGSIVAYDWDYDGDNAWDLDPGLTHTYDRTGWHRIQLRVIDNAGNEAFASRVLEVVAPSAGSSQQHLVFEAWHALPGLGD
jgi:hypothetical protein